MTRKIFYENAYDATCAAKVVAVDGNAVVLDQTVFYGESGGQPGDTGTLNGVKVLGTKVREGDKEILHVVEDASKFSVGGDASGMLDWERRLRIMRTHTAMHLLSQLAETVGGKCQVAGSGMKEAGEGHVDIAAERRIAGESVPQLEAKCNEAIKAGAEVKTFFDGQRKDYRYVQIAGFAALPCGGTHVRDISQIGIVKLRRENVGKGKDRIIVTLSS